MKLNLDLSVQWLRLAVSKEPNRVGVSLAPAEDENILIFRDDGQSR
jgi:hypothetical protein